jgi:integrase
VQADAVRPKIVQERLAHSSVAITMDIYSHVMTNMQREAVDRVDEALQQALQKRASRAIG